MAFSSFNLLNRKVGALALCHRFPNRFFLVGAS
jgi:hypothetical protein